MKKKITGFALSFLCALLFAVQVPADAQQPKKVPRIGYLSPLSPSTDNRSEAFRQGLSELGYIEGQNIAIEYRYTEGNVDRASAHATELARLKVDVIVAAGGDRWIQAAKNATSTIPIVMMGQGSDPVAAGFVESLARPGGNITGLSNLTNQLGGKRLEVFKEAVTKLSRVGVLYDAAIPSSAGEMKEVQTAARPLGLTLQTWEIKGADDFDNVFTEIGKQRPNGLYVAIAGALMTANQKRIAGFALKSRLPSMYGNRAAVDAGGLMSYAADLVDRYRRTAYYVDKILKGAKPADLPVEQPRKFELVINLKTAKALNLIIPQSVLYRADKVIR